jgi:hypothetical protein
METAQTPTCPVCHTPLDITDIFCSTCGTNVKTGESSLSTIKMIYVTAITLLLPPLGLIWAFKYLKSRDPRIKKFGKTVIIMTIISLIINVILIAAVLQQVQTQLNQQLPPELEIYQGLY